MIRAITRHVVGLFIFFQSFPASACMPSGVIETPYDRVAAALAGADIIFIGSVQSASSETANFRAEKGIKNIKDGESYHLSSISYLFGSNCAYRMPLVGEIWFYYHFPKREGDTYPFPGRQYAISLRNQYGAFDQKLNLFIKEKFNFDVSTAKVPVMYGPPIDLYADARSIADQKKRMQDKNKIERQDNYRRCLNTSENKNMRALCEPLKEGTF